MFHSSYPDSSLQEAQETQNESLVISYPSQPHNVPVLSFVLSPSLEKCLLTYCSGCQMHTHIFTSIPVLHLKIPISIPPFLISASSIDLHLPHFLMQSNSNGFYWLGDSSQYIELINDIVKPCRFSTDNQ